MDQFSEKTVERIQAEHIVPKPKWRFLLRDSAVWVGFGASIFIGSVAVATMLFILSDEDWDIAERLGNSLLGHVFVALPYFWIGVLSLFAALTYYNFRQTRRGYRFATPLVIGGSVALSVLVGAGLFRAGFDSEPHEFMVRNVSSYRRMMFAKDIMWSRPELGIQCGRIVSWTSTDDFSIRDPRGRIFVVRGGPGLPPWPLNIATSGMRAKVRLFGAPTTGSVFFVDSIRPWNYGPWNTELPQE